MEFDNDTIFDIMLECWNAGFVYVGISICRYCGMLNKQINPNQIYKITNGQIRRKIHSCNHCHY